MSPAGHPRVAVVGAGEIGRGWAALLASAGWPAAVYDADANAVHDGVRDVHDRVQTLVRLGRAGQDAAASGLSELRAARSLLQAVHDADWIIEAAPEDLAIKQRLLEQIEQVARAAAAVTSSTSGLHASALCARLRHPERLLVAHPLNPVELMPVVELVPGPATDPDLVEDVRWWLQQLGRAPIVLRREVSGNVVGRISAAVWRECIQLVLDGVVDVKDLDRAVALGPSLGWVAAGPNLSYHLGAGDLGVSAFLENLLTTYEQWWGELAGWRQLDREDQLRLIRAIERAYDGRVPELRRARDQRLGRLLTAVDDRRHDPSPARIDLPPLRTGESSAAVPGSGDPTVVRPTGERPLADGSA